MDSKNIITIMIIIAGATLVVGVFIYFGGPRSGVSGGLQTVLPLSAEDSNALSRDFLLALSSLNNLELNASFFEDKIFKLLVDYSKDIKDEELGRDNPFLPVSGGATSASAPATKSELPPKVAMPPIVISPPKAVTPRAPVALPTPPSVSEEF